MRRILIYGISHKACRSNNVNGGRISWITAETAETARTILRTTARTVPRTTARTIPKTTAQGTVLRTIPRTAIQEIAPRTTTANRDNQEKAMILGQEFFLPFGVLKYE